MEDVAWRLVFHDAAGVSRFTRRLTGKNPKQLPTLPLGSGSAWEWRGSSSGQFESNGGDNGDEAVRAAFQGGRGLNPVKNPFNRQGNPGKRQCGAVAGSLAWMCAMMRGGVGPLGHSFHRLRRES